MYPIDLQFSVFLSISLVLYVEQFSIWYMYLKLWRETSLQFPMSNLIAHHLKCFQHTRNPSAHNNKQHFFFELILKTSFFSSARRSYLILSNPWSNPAGGTIKWVISYYNWHVEREFFFFMIFKSQAFQRYIVSLGFQLNPNYEKWWKKWAFFRFTPTIIISQILSSRFNHRGQMENDLHT